MSTAEAPAVLPAALKDRVVKILTQPKSEWEVIEAESTSAATLYRGYIALLAAIPALATFIGMSVVGLSLPIVGTFRVGLARGLANAVVSYVLALVGVYVAAVVIEKLAPSFESRPDRLQALKLVTYASTPVWLAGVLYILPALGVLVLLASIYAIYLFYLGVPVMMKTPAEKVIPYMLVAAVVTIVVSLVMGMLSASLTGVRPGSI